MKYKYILIFFFTFSLNTIYSQIPIRENTQTEPKIIDKSEIPIYDSLSDFGEQTNVLGYLKFVGQELYLPPATTKENISSTYPPPPKTDNLGVNIGYGEVINLRYPKQKEYLPDSVFVYDGYEMFYDKNSDNKVITDIYNPFITITVSGPYYDKSIQLKKNVFDKTYKIIGITTKNNINLREIDPSKKINQLRFWLTTSTNDTIFFDKDMQSSDKTLKPFILMAFYKKNLELYKNKDFFVFNVNEDFSKNKEYLDLNTGERIKFEYGDKWICNDISLIETENDKTLMPFYVLKNESNKEIKIPFGQLIKNGLISSEELKYAYQIWLENEKNKELTQQRIQKDFKTDCIKKFGSNYGEKIANGNLELGMSKEMILFGFGSPYKTLYSKSYQGTKEMFFYNNTVLYFQENKLIKILKYD